MKILVIFTCFNRKMESEQCIKSIANGNDTCHFTFLVADDGSTDGTFQMLQELQNEYDIHIIKGNGKWFYSGGMNNAMKYALEQMSRNFDYLLMINNDVRFIDRSIEKLIKQSKEQYEAIIVGVMCNNAGRMSYGAIKYMEGYKYKKLGIEDWRLEADTFNANCVLIPYDAFLKAGVIDPYYKHSLGDFDYGLSLKKCGYKIFPSKEFVGVCNNNLIQNTWMDISLTKMERIKKKEGIKGAPSKQWFYFLKKNFGIINALKGTITPYIRIILGR